jgi:DNA-binding HxlR family transcriptional regulator
MAAPVGHQPRGEATVTVALPLADQLAAIRARCQDLSLQHRLALPPDLVRERIGTLARDASAVFSDRVIEICYLLDQYGSLRYNELRRMIGVISTRTLADKLAFLHQQGLVGRRLYDESPPRVEYALTDRGKVLTDLLFPAILHVAPEANA